MHLIMRELFYIVYSILNFISELTGLSYNEINIIVYYILLPFLYFTLIDKILKQSYCKISFLVVWLVLFLSCDSFKSLSDLLFNESVRFLLSFQYIGLSYVFASVIVCIFIPFVIFIVLLYHAFPQRFKFLMKSKNS